MIPSFDPGFAASSDWALMYRACGLQVVPSRMPAEDQNWKRPALADWKSLQETIVPQATFERWYGTQGEHVRRPNMGLLTGRASGNIFVIDLDEYKTPAAAGWWRGVLEVHNSGLEPETWQQTTGGGGRQLFYRAPAEWRAPTNKTPIGVDVRGQGGFAVLPPSMHVSGSAYLWRPGAAPWETEIADAPDWLLTEVNALVGRYGGDAERSALPNERTPSPVTEIDAFGSRIDGRDHYMRDLIWAAVVNWYRDCPIPPSEAESQSRMREVYAVYERKVKSRLAGVEPPGMLLEREGRGATLFAEKWRRAIGKWGSDIAAAAARPLEKDEWREAQRPEPAHLLAQPPARPVEPSRFVFETIGDLRKLPPVQWLVKDWVPEGATGIFYGKWAAGKSFIGFDLALHLAYGMQDWHGAQLPGVPTEVLVIAREGHQGFVNRVDAFKQFHGLPDDDDRITFMRGSVSFMREDEFNALCAAIAATGKAFKLILVDTVARVLPGVDMNEQQTVTLFMERIGVLGAATGAATIGVHHQNKTGGMMGSTFFEANSDFVFEVSRTGDEDGPLSAGEIVCTKMKDGEDRWKRSVSYQKIALSVAPDGPSSLVVASIKKPTALPVSRLSRDLCLRILSFVGEEWRTGTPLSIAKNAGDGRYAPEVIAKRFEVQVGEIEWLVREWLNARPRILEVQVADKKSKQKGLAVVGSIDG